MSILLSSCASLAAAMMLVRSMAKDIPDPVWSYLHSGIHYICTPNQLTIVIDDKCGISRNQLYNAAKIYLCTKISPSTKRFKVTQAPRQENLSLAMEKKQELIDTFQGIKLKWRLLICNVSRKEFFELCFHKKFRDRVLQEYLPFVLKKAKEIEDMDTVVKLYTKADAFSSREGHWGSFILDHPATFEKLAMEPEMKKKIMDDLDMFVRGKEYYKKVGRAWRRGYLLYGPTGTGKSTLIAAMANHLKYDIYDLELTSLTSNSALRSTLASTTNRSIIVIEDIDCSVEMQDRKHGLYPYHKDVKLTLSGLLNFIDGLWSGSCGDERIIVFTTNNKDRLDSALLRPGRMDMQIHMSYCTTQVFKQLASNYLSVRDHPLFGEIEGFIENLEVTPAEVVGELMKNKNPDNALDGVVNLLKRKQMEIMEENTTQVETQDAKRMKSDGSEKKTLRKSRRRGVTVKSRKR